MEGISPPFRLKLGSGIMGKHKHFFKKQFWIDSNCQGKRVPLHWVRLRWLAQTLKIKWAAERKKQRIPLLFLNHLGMLYIHKIYKKVEKKTDKSSFPPSICTAKCLNKYKMFYHAADEMRCIRSYMCVQISLTNTYKIHLKCAFKTSEVGVG